VSGLAFSGTLQEKIDPYLKPLYDALYDMLDVERVDRHLERGVIEIAPIAFMRGRTLNDSFVILDEAHETQSRQFPNRESIWVTSPVDDRFTVVADSSEEHLSVPGLCSALHRE